MDEIGLFPLDLVLLPGEQRPLHVFEPRYRELIGECLEGEDEFGLVLADDGGMRSVGTRAAVVEVLERYDDGRLDVVVEGRRRFRIAELTDGRDFATALVADLDDDPADEPDADQAARTIDAYRRVVAAAGVEVDELEPAAGDLAFQIATRVDLGNDVKQVLVESVSEQDRLSRLEPLLGDAEGAVRADREMRERAASNGRVEPLP